MLFVTGLHTTWWNIPGRDVQMNEQHSELLDHVPLADAAEDDLLDEGVIFNIECSCPVFSLYVQTYTMHMHWS